MPEFLRLPGDFLKGPIGTRRTHERFDTTAQTTGRRSAYWMLARTDARNVGLGMLGAFALASLVDSAALMTHNLTIQNLPDGHSVSVWNGDFLNSPVMGATDLGERAIAAGVDLNLAMLVLRSAQALTSTNK